MSKPTRPADGVVGTPDDEPSVAETVLDLCRLAGWWPFGAELADVRAALAAPVSAEANVPTLTELRTLTKVAREARDAFASNSDMAFSHSLALDRDVADAKLDAALVRLSQSPSATRETKVADMVGEPAHSNKWLRSALATIRGGIETEGTSLTVDECIAVRDWLDSPVIRTATAMTRDDWKRVADWALKTYDWTKSETRAITDFILTAQNCVDDELGQPPVAAPVSQPSATRENEAAGQRRKK